ncbi:hypothetical protein PISL3812_07621 [Talaromyces islandicus]|uniref:Uncharacterized protein n=1 Tax=Talaromyces islandicus TaxID=28573 RepID=A0A0U1M4V5_TALIS|nr:hypothetical protein PISL3812_07621 [Talaromyces islandicus]
MLAAKTPMSISAVLNPPQKTESDVLPTNLQLSLCMEKDSMNYRYENFDGATNTSSARRDRRRPPRPKYMEEEMYFIWYHRIDLEEDWKECADAFNRQFPSPQGRNVQGIQCKFYRFINSKRCPTVREQRRLKDGELITGRRGRGERLPQYGVVEWCNIWYPWMKAEHAVPGLRLGPQATPVGRLDDRRTSYSGSSSEATTPEPYSPGAYSDGTESQEEETH